MRWKRVLFWLVVVVLVAGVVAWAYSLRRRILEQRLGDAMSVDDERTIRSLLNAFPSPLGAKDESGWAVLHWTVWKGYADVVKEALARGADVNARDGTSWTALHEAAAIGDKVIAEMLIAAGADVNARCDFGRTPVHWLVGQEGMGKMSVTTPRDMDATGPVLETGRHLRHGVRWEGDAAQKTVLRLLIDAGADVNTVDSPVIGRTPLHDAVISRKDPEFARILLAAGADPNPKDQFGQTPLEAAASDGKLALVKQMTSRPLSPENLDGAILAAALEKQDEVVSYLLGARSDPQSPLRFWRAAEGTAPDRMGLPPAKWSTAKDFRTVWGSAECERLFCLTFAGGSSSSPKLCDDWYCFDVHVFDRDMTRVRTGDISFTERYYPYALVEVFSNSARQHPTLRGRWTLALAMLRTPGGWEKYQGVLDAEKPLVLKRSDTPKDAANVLEVRLVGWEDDNITESLPEVSDLEDVRFRWAETGPPIFKNAPAKGEKP